MAGSPEGLAPANFPSSPELLGALEILIRLSNESQRSLYARVQEVNQQLWYLPASFNVSVYQSDIIGLLRSYLTGQATADRYTLDHNFLMSVFNAMSSVELLANQRLDLIAAEMDDLYQYYLSKFSPTLNRYRESAS